MMSTRRAFLSAGGASAIALSLAACSRSQPKTAETVASGTPIAEPGPNDKQLEEILQRVQTGLAAADKEKNADKLKEAMSGPAARIRAGYCADDTNISSQWMKLIWEVYAVHSLSTYLCREQPHGSSQILQARLPSPELSLPHTARYSKCAANAASISGSTHSCSMFNNIGLKRFTLLTKCL